MSASGEGSPAVRGRVRILADPAALAEAAAAELTARAAEALAARGLFTLALSGGSTPRRLYARLAAGAGALPWQATHFFWGDEREVPPDHPESNYRMASEAMLERAAVPDVNVHRIRAEGGAEPAATAYEEELKRFFTERRLVEGGWPRFDVILLGLGADGHTASLFPGVAALAERERLVAAPWVEKLGGRRVTLTAPLINRARAVLFLVAGADKAEALQAILETEPDPRLLPARLVRPLSGELLWLVDRPAARLLAAAHASESGG